MSLAEVFGFITGAACVWLLVKQNIWTWPTGIASQLIYIFIFFHSKLYGDMALQFFFIAISLYGWWHWLHPDDVHRGELGVQRITGAAFTVVAIVTAAIITVIALGLRRFTDSNVPWLDATTTSLSLSAQFMQSKKWIENWWFWIAADVIYIGLYIYKHLFITALLYAVFMAMCIAGLLEWRRDLTREARAA